MMPARRIQINPMTFRLAAVSPWIYRCVVANDESDVGNRAGVGTGHQRDVASVEEHARRHFLNVEALQQRFRPDRRGRKSKSRAEDGGNRQDIIHRANACAPAAPKSPLMLCRWTVGHSPTRMTSRSWQARDRSSLHATFALALIELRAYSLPLGFRLQGPSANREC